MTRNYIIVEQVKIPTLLWIRSHKKTEASCIPQTPVKQYGTDATGDRWRQKVKVTIQTMPSILLVQ